MECTTSWHVRYREWLVMVWAMAMVGAVILAVSGARQETLAGWIACPAQRVEIGQREDRRRSERISRPRFAWRAGWTWMRGSCMVAAARSEALLGLVFVTGSQEWRWVWVLPWIAWVWKGLGVAHSCWGQHKGYQFVGRMWDGASCVAMLSLVMRWGHLHLSVERPYGVWTLGIGHMMATGETESYIGVREDETGKYHVQMRGTFDLHVDGTVMFYKRILVIFLGLLQVPGQSRGSRRTRDGRTPFVRQEQMAAWFGVPQPHISLWFRYWQEQDWRRMLSQLKGEVLTEEVQRCVIGSWVKAPWWSAQRLWEHLRAQGRAITCSQVKQIGQESGWAILREALRHIYHIGAESFRPQETWLVEQLLTQVQRLVEQLEAYGGLTPERQLAIADLEALCEELDLRPAITVRPLPWMWHVEQLLFGHWELVDDDSVRCIYCGTTEVSRKSRQGRLKRYMDQQGNEQTVQVFRYYCRNPACHYKTFTNLPPNLIPYSKWTLNHHLEALQTYEWAHSMYRCTSQMLSVSKMTAYRWVSAFGYQLLPVAALFGVVRSSGVVGIDEKYVLVPKNDKPVTEMKRWMYVYFAVDCYTYDLLHIAIYPHNSKLSARAFLLALRAKGYHPRVIVTDMRVDYRDVVAQVFPKAVHHECIFHALQQVRKHAKDAYGTHYAQTHPEVVQLFQEIDRIFDARTKRTAARRYEKVLSQQKTFVTQTPDAVAIFDFLERHWPFLVNAVESQIIPTTNNATEQVIRIFTQHYKTFSGFEHIESARTYLGVFEKVYRFTPFSCAAHERIRGKCPLELAGYEVRKLPFSQLFRGLALQWPSPAFQELVPNV
jgi:transposase IS66 family protein